MQRVSRCQVSSRKRNKKSQEKKTKEKSIKLYVCGIDWDVEANYWKEMSTLPVLYPSIKQLKKDRLCWQECGIVELNVSLTKWVLKQNLIGIPIKDEKRKNLTR